MDQQKALEVKQMTVIYEKNPVLWDLTFDVPVKNLVAIIGPNGAGKSTLIKTVLGLIRPLSGNVRLFGCPFKQVRNRISYVPQRESVDWDFPITVLELVLMGLYGSKGLCRWLGKKERLQALKLLDTVGIEPLAHRQISQLSGGQQQRAFIARALIQEADLYFMDEPFIGIDSASMQVISSLLRQLQQQGKTIFVVHHDLESIPSNFDWVLMLNMRLVANGPVSEVFNPEFIQKTFGKDLNLFEQAIQLKQAKQTGKL